MLYNKEYKVIIIMVIIDNTYENNLIVIGQNKKENDQIISEAHMSDLWFHIANLPSCHVIISNCKDHPPTKKMIKYAASLVKANTKYRNYRSIKVNYTRIKNIRKTKKAGKVIIKKKPNIIKV